MKTKGSFFVDHTTLQAPWKSGRMQSFYGITCKIIVWYNILPLTEIDKSHQKQMYHYIQKNTTTSLLHFLQYHVGLQTSIPYDGFHLSSIFDQELSALPQSLASLCNCWVIIAKPYQVLSHLITSWPVIVLSSLKLMADFVHSICLIVVLL
jgi:hypothetical protein